MNILDAFPYHGTNIYVIFAHGSLRIFDYAAASHGQLTSCEKIAVAHDGGSVTLDGSTQFSAYQLYTGGKPDRRVLPLGYVKKGSEIAADPIEVPIVKRIFDLYLQGKFCSFPASVNMAQAEAIVSEETWRKCQEIIDGRAAGNSPELGQKF